MLNPWVRLPTNGPFVLDEDKSAIASIRANSRPEHQPRTELIPEPFGGNINAPVVVLSSHPGFHPEDIDAHSDPAFRKAAFHSLAQGRSAWPMYALDPRFRFTPAGRYSRKMLWDLEQAVRKRLGGSDEEAWQHLARSILSVQHFPYHRETGKKSERVPSQEFGFHLVRGAINRNALVIIRNADARWFEAIPELAHHQRCVILKNRRMSNISPGNLPEGWFERVVDALLDAAVLGSLVGNHLQVEALDDLTLEQRQRVLRQIDRIVRDAKLREDVIAAWGPACAFCGLDLVGLDGSQECEVAHVVPVADDGPDAIGNALPLCRTHHWAFDHHLWAIDPNSLTLRVRDEYRAAASLGPHHGKSLRGKGTARLGRNRLHARWERFSSFVSFQK